MGTVQCLGGTANGSLTCAAGKTIPPESLPLPNQNIKKAVATWVEQEDKQQTGRMQLHAETPKKLETHRKHQEKIGTAVQTGVRPSSVSIAPDEHFEDATEHFEDAMGPAGSTQGGSLSMGGKMAVSASQSALDAVVSITLDLPTSASSNGLAGSHVLGQAGLESVQERQQDTTATQSKLGFQV